MGAITATASHRVGLRGGTSNRKWGFVGVLPEVGWVRAGDAPTRTPPARLEWRDMTMLRPATMRSIVGFAAVTVMKCPTVVAFVRPSVRVSAVRHVSFSAAVSINSCLLPSPHAAGPTELLYFTLSAYEGSTLMPYVAVDEIFLTFVLREFCMKTSQQDRPHV